MGELSCSLSFPWFTDISADLTGCGSILEMAYLSHIFRSLFPGSLQLRAGLAQPREETVEKTKRNLLVTSALCILRTFETCLLKLEICQLRKQHMSMELHEMVGLCFTLSDQVLWLFL